MCNSLGLKSHKRICLFAGYNPDNKIAVHVLDYLRELSRYCDVYYLADGELEPNELEKAKSLCNNAWVKDHGKYDFGSYSELARDYVGWETISQYDELILANDSCFCLQEFGPVFAKMDNESTDVWCLMATDELNTDRIFSLEDYQKIPSKKIPMFCAGSYFLAFRRSVVEDKRFRDFLNEVKIGQDRQQICLKYEMGLTANLIKWGYRISGFIKVVYKNAAIYGEQAFRLLKQGFPLLKARIFIDNPMSVANLKDWIDVTVALVGNDRLPHYLNDLSGLEPSVARLCKYRPRPSLVDPSAPEPPLARPKPRRKISWKRWLLHMKNDWVPPLMRNGLLHMVWMVTPPYLVNVYRAARSKIPVLLHRGDIPQPIGTRYAGSSETARANSNGPLRKRTERFFVVHFNVASDVITGGMLSINRFVKHTVELADAFGIDVLVSGVPLKNPPVDYTGFRAVRPMVSFNTIVARTQPDRLILHIPEVCTQDFVEGLKEHHLRWLKSIPRLQINIMNQNNELMPDPLYVEKCRDITDEVTITAAHLGYATQDLADNYDCPVGLLTPFLPEFDRTDFEKKEKTIVLSPDDSLPPGGVTKERVLNMIARELPDYKTIVIENMKFDVYRKTISSARFAITFGEGYDGYFLEPFLCDSVAFAVYNETFFPSEFADLPTIYTSWESLYDNLAADIRRLEAHADEYRRVQAVTEKLIRRYTSREISWRNLVDFYRRKFTFLPKIYRDSALFANDSDPMDGRKQGLVNE